MINKIRLSTSAVVEISTRGCHFYTPISTHPEDVEYDDRTGLRRAPHLSHFLLTTEEVESFIVQYMHGKCALCHTPLPDGHDPQDPALCETCLQSTITLYLAGPMTTPSPATPPTPFEEAIGRIVTLKHGMGTHVGTLGPDPDREHYWQVSYGLIDEDDYSHVIGIHFSDCQVVSVGHDEEHKRPLIKVDPFK